MSTISANRSGPTPDGQLPASPDTFHPSLDDHPTQSSDGLRLDSDTSRILIVDDNPDILKLVSRMAKGLGYHPTAAEDGLRTVYEFGIDVFLPQISRLNHTPANIQVTGRFSDVFGEA